MKLGRKHDEKDTLAVVPWFWRDWRASKARAYFMSTKNYLGLAVYRELLDAHWGEEDCALPGDDVELAALAGVSLEEWLSVREVVCRWLDVTDDGRRRNARTFREWKLAKENRTAARRKAKRAAKALWDKRKEAKNSACLEHAPSNAQAMLEVCPTTPTPSPSPSPTPFRTDRTNGAPANPLVGDRRPALESEFLSLVRFVSESEDKDPEEIARQASHYDGASRSKLNPASMSDDRLLNSLMDLREWKAAILAKRPRLQA